MGIGSPMKCVTPQGMEFSGMSTLASPRSWKGINPMGDTDSERVTLLAEDAHQGQATRVG